MNKEKAIKSIMDKIAKPLNLDLIDTASGIIEIAVSMLIDEFRAVSTSKGIDLRDFVMFAFGGAGPMHCALMLKELGISSIVIPSAAGAFSALGFLCSDLRHDFVRTHIMRTREMDVTKVEEIFTDLESQGVKILKREGVSASDIVIIRSVDMRYVGQAYEINIPFKFEKISPQVSEMLVQTFNESYQNFYGHSTPKESTEMVNFRVTAIGKVKKPPIEKISLGKRELEVKDRGEVYFKEAGWVNCPFYDREGLSFGNKIRGPAIIEEYTSTTVIPPDVEATIDEYLNIVIRRVQR